MSEATEVTSERNRLVGMGIALIVLAILASITHRMPEAYRIVTGYLSVGGIIKAVILIIMLGLVLSARPLLAMVVVHCAHSGFKTKELPERRQAASHVTGLGTEIANVIAIAILWPIVARIVSILLLMDVQRDFDWMPIVVTVVFVAVLLWRLYVAYQSLMPVLDATSGMKAKLACPECGTSKPLGGKFCSSCGGELRISQTKAESQTTLCPRCGAQSKPGNRFCHSCGAPLVEK